MLDDFVSNFGAELLMEGISVRKTAWLIFTVTALTSAAAQSQTFDPKYPVCMRRAVMGGGLYIDCSYTSMAQCAQTASGLPATCLINPYFASTRNEPRPFGHRRRHLH